MYVICVWCVCMCGCVCVSAGVHACGVCSDMCMVCVGVQAWVKTTYTWCTLSTFPASSISSVWRE